MVTPRSPGVHSSRAQNFKNERNDAAYTGIGLAASHIEQLTGYPADQILDALHAHGIPVRPAASFSPWYRRTYPPRTTTRPDHQT